MENAYLSMLLAYLLMVFKASALYYKQSARFETIGSLFWVNPETGSLVFSLTDKKASKKAVNQISFIRYQFFIPLRGSL
ncbi:MAG: hypothetical protein ACRBB6_14355 [Neptuniibacter sp.]